MTENRLAKHKVNFASVKDVTIGELFGTETISVTDMIKKLWDFIKARGLRS